MKRPVHPVAAVIAVLVAAALAPTAPLLSLSTGAERSDAVSPQEIRTAIDEARALLESGKPAKASGKLAVAAHQLAELFQLDRVPSGARLLADACKSLKDDLELEGVDVSGIEIPTAKLAAARKSAGEPPAVKPAKPTAAAAFLGPRGAVAGGPQAVSFVKQVVPILMARCGGCHVTGRKGGFQMASYEGLMKTGRVQRGVGDASRLIEVIESGDMPRGGGSVPPDELATLKRWIDSGAVCDAAEPTAEIAMLAVPVGGAAAPRAAAMPAGPVVLKPGDVSFAFEIAPLLLKNCAGCHGGEDPAENLTMTAFENLLRGGDSGVPILPGRGVESLLIRKLKGKDIEGQRMPISRPPLSPEVITLFEKWIDQGARLDLLSPKDPLENVAAAGRARSLSHEELMKVRFEASEKLWRRAIPDDEPVTDSRGIVRIVGNLKQSQIEPLAEAAETALTRSQQLLVGDDRPLLKGGAVVYAFAKPYDYSSFWQMVLRNDRPQGLLGNAGVSGDVAYGAIVMPASNTGADTDDVAADLTAAAAEQIVAAAFLVRGAPAWFASGAGRAVAMKVAAKAPCVKQWRLQTGEQLQALGSAADYFEGHAGPVAMAAIGGGFVGAIARSETKLRAVVAAIDAGTPFEQAFRDVFKADPQPLFEAWAAQEARKPAGSRRR